MGKSSSPGTFSCTPAGAGEALVVFLCNMGGKNYEGTIYAENGRSATIAHPADGSMQLADGKRIAAVGPSASARFCPGSRQRVRLGPFRDAVVRPDAAALRGRVLPDRALAWEGVRRTGNAYHGKSSSRSTAHGNCRAVGSSRPATTGSSTAPRDAIGKRPAGRCRASVTGSGSSGWGNRTWP